MSNPTKTGLWARIKRLFRANANAALDKAEDPEKMMRQTIADASAAYEEYRQNVAQQVGLQKAVAADALAAHNKAQDWLDKAQAASNREDAMRASGRAAEADDAHRLAILALENNSKEEARAKSLDEQATAMSRTVEGLKKDLFARESALTAAKEKSNELIARGKIANAQVEINSSMKTIDAIDPTSVMGRVEDKVRAVEATAAGQAELAGESLESQFAELEASSRADTAETRLAMLKAGVSPTELPSASSTAAIEAAQR